MAVPQSFPAKIYQILENESPDIIQWNENGISFRIVDHGRFEREIVPKYFRHNQISSVQRQLNLYGFKCISRGEFKRSFFHPKFRRGDWETVRKLTRYAPVKKNPGPSDGTLSTSSAEPDANKEEAKREERPVHTPMYNPFFSTIAGGNSSMNNGQSDAAAASFNRNYMMGPSNGAWLESWDRQESANSMSARMMGIPPHFAYAMMPMHAAAAMHHMSTHGLCMPPPPGAFHGSASNSDLGRTGPTRQSDLSNRLGFKFGTGEQASPKNVNSTAVEDSTAPAEQINVPRNHSLEHFHGNENRAMPSSSSRQAVTHEHAYQHGHGHGQSADYDLMLELGMFESLPTDLYHPTRTTAASSSSSSSSSSGGSSANMPVAEAGHVYQQVGHSVHAMRLPTLTHELHPLPKEAMQVSKPAGAGHAHAALEVDATSHPPGAEDEENEHSACSLPVADEDKDQSSEQEQEQAHLAAIATTGTSSPSASTKTKGAAVDMACNTMLTYSKVHDALVYYRIVDV